MANPVAEVFAQAAGLVAADSNRRGNCLSFAAGEEVVYTGDLHGHRANLAKIIAFCDLPNHPSRRLVLQELTHCHQLGPGRSDPSLDALLRAARLKLSVPGRVFFLMGNHDLAEITGQEITKDGRGLCRDFRAHLQATFGPATGEVRGALERFYRAMPLAGRCANGMFMTHSLPSPDRMDRLDWDVLDRPYRPEDFLRGGSVYEWTWGRGHTAEQLRQVADRLGVRQFLLAHQPVRGGYEIQHERAVLLSTDGSHGAVLVFDAGQDVPDADLPRHIRPVVALSARARG